MTFRILCISALAALSIGSTAAAQDTGNYYVKLFGGVSALQGDEFTFGNTVRSLSYGTGITFGGAVGYDYANSPFSAEIEFAYRSSDASDLEAGLATEGDFATTSLMLNGYYTFTTASALTPYVGLGVGFVTEIDFDLEGGSGVGEYNDRGRLGLQAMIGAQYPISDRVSLYGEARYFTAGSVDLKGTAGETLTADYDVLDLNLGLALRF